MPSVASNPKQKSSSCKGGERLSKLSMSPAPRRVLESNCCSNLSQSMNPSKSSPAASAAELKETSRSSWWWWWCTWERASVWGLLPVGSWGTVLVGVEVDVVSKSAGAGEWGLCSSPSGHTRTSTGPFVLFRCMV